MHIYIHLCDRNKIDGEEDEGIVLLGWPPIKDDLLHRDQGRRVVPVIGNSKSMYVKVKMEGVPIGRKIDLTLYI